MIVTMTIPSHSDYSAGLVNPSLCNKIKAKKCTVEWLRKEKKKNEENRFIQLIQTPTTQSYAIIKRIFFLLFSSTQTTRRDTKQKKFKFQCFSSHIIVLLSFESCKKWPYLNRHRHRSSSADFLLYAGLHQQTSAGKVLLVPFAMALHRREEAKKNLFPWITDGRRHTHRRTRWMLVSFRFATYFTLYNLRLRVFSCLEIDRLELSRALYSRGSR